jgi:hypothetical protein
MKRDYNTGSNCGSNYCYYYLHVNGELLEKDRSYNPDSFEESDFVRCWWKISLDSRLDAYKMLIRAHTLGASETCIQNLVDKWRINDEECAFYILKDGLKFDKKGMLWSVYANDQQFGGLGDTLFKAVCAFYDLAVHA